MGGTQSSAKRFAQKMLEKNPNYFRDLGRVGGTKARGYRFAYGKIDPHDAGKRGGRPAGKLLFRAGVKPDKDYIPCPLDFIDHRGNLRCPQPGDFGTIRRAHGIKHPHTI
jgi:general stress protein YciG